MQTREAGDVQSTVSPLPRCGATVLSLQAVSFGQAVPKRMAAAQTFAENLPQTLVRWAALCYTGF